MPVQIYIDNSIFMHNKVNYHSDGLKTGDKKTRNRFDAALAGVNGLLEIMDDNEFIAAATFNNNVSTLIPLDEESEQSTSDSVPELNFLSSGCKQQISAKISKVQCSGRSNLIPVLKAIRKNCNSWTTQAIHHILVLSSTLSISSFNESAEEFDQIVRDSMPLAANAQLHFILIGDDREGDAHERERRLTIIQRAHKQTSAQYRDAIGITTHFETADTELYSTFVHYIASDVSETHLTAAFGAVGNAIYARAIRSAIFRCGAMRAKQGEFYIKFVPPIYPTAEINIASSAIEVLGFVPEADILFVPEISRHSLIATFSDKHHKMNKKEVLAEQRIPHPLPMLVPALYQHQYAALVNFQNSDQYAFIRIDKSDTNDSTNITPILCMLAPSNNAVNWWPPLSDLQTTWISSTDDLKRCCGADGKSERQILRWASDCSADLSYTKQDTDWTTKGKLRDDTVRALRCLQKRKFGNFYAELTKVLSFALLISLDDYPPILADLIEKEVESCASTNSADDMIGIRKHGLHAAKLIRGGEFKYNQSIEQASLKA